MAHVFQNGKLLLYIHLQTGARRDAIGPLYGGRLRVCIKARPVAGKANKYLVAYIAREFGVRKSCVSILDGLHSRDKTLSIEGPVKRPAWFLTLTGAKLAGKDSTGK